MSRLLQFLRTTIVGGVLFLVPLVVLSAIIGKALQVAHRVSDPITARLFPEAPPPLLLAAAVVVLVLFCFLAGLLAVTPPARRIVGWLEGALLSKIPGYTFLKSAGASALGVESTVQYPVVLARIEDSWQFGFVVERLPGGNQAVYVPGSPNPLSGAVYFMGADRLRETEIPMHVAMKCLRGLGAGSAALMRDPAALRWTGAGD
jgi:uncharacterized membrane protein